MERCSLWEDTLTLGPLKVIFDIEDERSRARRKNGRRARERMCVSYCIV